MHQFSPIRSRRKYYPLFLFLIVALAISLSLFSAVPFGFAVRAQDGTRLDGQERRSERGRQQREALVPAKKARTPVQRKIDSHLLAADKMRRGEPVAEGIPALRSEIESD